MFDRLLPYLAADILNSQRFGVWENVGFYVPQIPNACCLAHSYHQQPHRSILPLLSHASSQYDISHLNLPVPRNKDILSCVLSCLFHHVSAPLFIGWSPNNICFCWIQRYKQYTRQPAGTRKKWIPSPREASPTRWGWKNQRRGWREENLAGRKHIHNIIYPPIYMIYPALNHHSVRGFPSHVCLPETRLSKKHELIGGFCQQKYVLIATYWNFECCPVFQNTIWLFNSSPCKITMLLIGKPLFLWAIYTMAMLVIARG